MAVAFDAKMTGGNSADGLNQETSSGTTCSSVGGMTVGAGATLLVGVIGFGPSVPTSVTMTWDGVSMTNQGGLVTDNSVTAALFTLVNPNAGAKTLTCSWTTATDAYMSCVSFTGTDTTTGINAPDTVTAVTAPTLTLTGASNGATVANFIGNA